MFMSAWRTYRLVVPVVRGDLPVAIDPGALRPAMFLELLGDAMKLISYLR